MGKVGSPQYMPRQTPLTRYEARQVKEIALWKAGEYPGLGQRMLRVVTVPLGEIVNAVLPKGPVTAAMEIVNKMAGQLAQDDSILEDPYAQSQGVKTLKDISGKSLEFSDKLSGRVIQDASKIAFGMGAATGTGGPIAAAAGLPVLVAGALRVIHRVSQAYGYGINDPGDKELMLHILALSTATDPGERAAAMVNYQNQIQSTFLHLAVEESAHNAVQRTLLGAELGSLVPGFGIALSAYLNREFVGKAGLAAQRVFQEHWLRERGKVTWIEPA
jgi:hypothetical protein